MGCCCSTKSKSEHVETLKYLNFHEGRARPEPTNACDRRYHNVRGEYATFAIGPFKEAQALFALLPGIIRTRIGYSGGKAILQENNITKILDHTEVIDIEFDPFVIKYEKLLSFFWKSHDPTTLQHQGGGSGLFSIGPPDRRLFSVENLKDAEGKNRYRSRIFYHSRDQKRLAEEALMRADRAIHSQPQMADKRIRTDIVPVSYIYLATQEDQQFYLQQDEFLTDVAKCSTSSELMYSHFASVLNGLCSPFATLEDLTEAESDFDLGLPSEAVAHLRDKIIQSQKEKLKIN